MGKIWARILFSMLHVKAWASGLWFDRDPSHTRIDVQSLENYYQVVWNDAY